MYRYITDLEPTHIKHAVDKSVFLPFILKDYLWCFCA